MTDEPKLLPCPFCGGEAVHILKAAGLIACKSCRAKTLVHATMSEAIAAWNTRATPPGMIRLDAPELLAMAEALRKADQALHDDGCRATMWPRPQINAAITAWEKLTK